MKDKKAIAMVCVVAVGLGVLPLLMDTESSYFIYFLFLTFCYIILSQSWNLVSGCAGQISLGQHAFFGVGAYTTAIIWTNDLTGTGYYFDPITMLLSAIVATVLAVAVGIPLLSKLRGDYFALGTLGLGEILRVSFIKGGKLTGGPVGLMLPSSAYTSMKPYYYTGLALALLALVVTYLIVRSRFGLALIAVREDESAAAANGINVLKYKISALAVSAFLAGLCGSLQAYYIFHVNPEGVFNLKWALYPILMCVMGGSGTILGPVIGAICLTAILSLTNIWFPSVHPIFTGSLIIVVMLFMPKGIVRMSIRSRFGRTRIARGTATSGT